MSADKIGRNDPCPCGSGEKYKYCCLRRDRQRHPTRTRQPSLPSEQVDQALRMTRQALRRAPPDRAQEIQRLVDQAERLAAYSSMEAEIEAAVDALKPHRPEFERLMSDPRAATDQAEKLFSEERFQPMRFTADDVQRAFEVVGYPPNYQSDPDKLMEILVAAAAYLTDDEQQRADLSRQLFMLLPEYVAAGRYMDAWLIQYSAYRLIEKPDESNPLTFNLFNQAFKEWLRRVDDQQEYVMKQLGIVKSELKQMSFKETQAWLEEQATDPEKQRRLEAYFQAYPALQEQARAEAADLRQEGLLLLEREDAGCLHLPPEEVDPWLQVFREQTADQEALARQALERGESIDPAIFQAMQNKFLDLAQDMAADLLTPERLDQLAADLKEYRRRLIEAEEKRASLFLYMLLRELEGDVVPAEHPFFVGLCAASLQARMKAMAEQARANAKEAADDTGVES